MTQTNNEIEVDLGKLLKYYLQHWLMLVISGVGMALLALVVTFFLITPKYQASVSLYVNNTLHNLQIETVDGNSLVTAQKLVQSYVNIIQSNTVLDKVIKKGHLDCTASDLRGMMTVKQADETEIFTVTISHPDSKMAAKAANAIADIAPNEIGAIIKGSSASVIDHAVEPEKPYTPSYPRNFILGGLLGGILMGIFLTFHYIFDMKITEEEQLSQRFELPVLGVIPVFEGEVNKKENHHKRGGHQA